MIGDKSGQGAIGALMFLVFAAIVYYTAIVMFDTIFTDILFPELSNAPYGTVIQTIFTIGAYLVIPAGILWVTYQMIVGSGQERYPPGY